MRHPLSERWWAARADHPLPQHFIFADAMANELDRLYAALVAIHNEGRDCRNR